MHLLVCIYILCITLSQTILKFTKVSYLLCFFNKAIATRASVLFLRFRYFELRDVLSNEIFINEFQYSVVSSFKDSGAGLVSPIWFVLLNSKNNYFL